MSTQAQASKRRIVAEAYTSCSELKHGIYTPCFVKPVATQKQEVPISVIELKKSLGSESNFSVEQLDRVYNGRPSSGGAGRFTYRNISVLPPYGETTITELRFVDGRFVLKRETSPEYFLPALVMTIYVLLGCLSGSMGSKSLFFRPASIGILVGVVTGVSVSVFYFGGSHVGYLEAIGAGNVAQIAGWSCVLLYDRYAYAAVLVTALSAYGSSFCILILLETPELIPEVFLFCLGVFAIEMAVYFAMKSRRERLKVHHE